MLHPGRAWFLLLLALSGPASAEELRFAVAGDAGKLNGATRSVVESIRRSGVRELVLPGDNLYDTNAVYEQVWGFWLEQGLKFSVVAIGNHHGGYAREMKYFGMPGEYYTVDRGPVQFLVLNSDNERNAAEQAAWLDGELTRSKAKVRFIVYHHPPYSLTRAHEAQEKGRFHAAILPVIWKHVKKVTALLLGHDHIASLAVVDGLPLVVSGAVHESRYEALAQGLEGGHKMRNLWFFSGAPHWASLHVDSRSGRVSVRFVDAEKGSRCEARLFPRPVKLGKECVTSLGKGMPGHPGRDN